MPRYDKNNPPPGRRYVKKPKGTGGDEVVRMSNVTPYFMYISGVTSGVLGKFIMPVRGIIDKVFVAVDSFDGENNRLIITKTGQKVEAREEVEIILGKEIDSYEVNLRMKRGNEVTFFLAGSASNIRLSFAFITAERKTIRWQTTS